MPSDNLKNIYEQMEERYQLTLTNAFALDSGFSKGCTVLCGASAAGKFQLYQDGALYVFDADRPDGSYTHWHPATVSEAIDDVEEFMQGRCKY